MTEEKKTDDVEETFKETQNERKSEEQKQQENKQEKKELQYSDSFVEYFSNLTKEYENVTSKSMKINEQSKEDMYIDMFSYINDDSSKENINDSNKLDYTNSYRNNAFNEFRNMIVNAILNSKKGKEEEKQKLISEIADLISNGSSADNYKKKTDKIMTDLNSILDPIEINGKTYNISKIFKGNMDNYFSHDTQPIALNNDIKPSSMILSATEDMLQKKYNFSGKQIEDISEFLKENIEIAHTNLKTISTEKQLAKAKEIAKKIREADNLEADPDIKKFDKGVKEELKELFFEPLIQLFSFLTCLFPFDDTKKTITKEIGKIGKKIVDLPFSTKEYIVDEKVKKDEKKIAEAKKINEKYKQSLEDSFKKINPEIANYLEELKEKFDYSKALDIPTDLNKGNFERNSTKYIDDETPLDSKTIGEKETKNIEDKKHIEKEKERREQKMEQQKNGEKKILAVQ